MEIRLAMPEDASVIEDIYRFYVETSTCTWQETPGTLAERQEWLAAHGERHPVIVAELEDAVVGWGALSPFRERSGYRFTVEDTVYVRDGLRGRGVGRVLLAELVSRAGALGYHSIVGGISADQPASLALHATLGFVEVARLPGVGWKLGGWRDLVYMQRSLVLLD